MQGYTTLTISNFHIWKIIPYLIISFTSCMHVFLFAWKRSVECLFHGYVKRPNARGKTWQFYSS